MDKLVELCDEFFSGYWKQDYPGSIESCAYCGALKKENEKETPHSPWCPVARYRKMKIPVEVDLSERLGSRGRNSTMAELMQPGEGACVEFWCHRMDQQDKAGTGIRGWFRGGLFWSHDSLDRYAPSEVTHWRKASATAVR